MPGGGAPGEGGGGKLPAALAQGFSDSMAQAILLPAAVLVIGLIAALMFTTPKHLQSPADTPAAAEAS